MPVLDERTSRGGMVMKFTSTESKQFVGRYLQALSGQSKTADLVERFVSDPSLAAHIRDVEAAFPEYELIAETLIAEQDLVAMRGTFHGVHRGPFAGIPPTGRSVAAPLMIIYRLENERIAEHWLHFDGASLVAQLQQPVSQASVHLAG
jgi:predicted ester cyclase